MSEATRDSAKAAAAAGAKQASKRRTGRRRSSPPLVPNSGWTAGLATLVGAAMAFLAVVTLAAGNAAGELAARWDRDLAGTATVQIPVAAGADPAPPLAAALEVLAGEAAIAEARPMADAELQALLAPWLGVGDWMAELPVPRLIAVRVKGTGPDPAELQQRLAAAVPGAVYDDHAVWRQPLVHAASALRRLAQASTALVILAAAAMVAMAARATLAGNAEVVRVIRLIGGEDSIIEREFVRGLSARTTLGAIAGTALGTGALWLLPELAPGTPMGLSLMPDNARWAAMLAGVPLAVGVIALATARLTVRALLHKML